LARIRIDSDPDRDVVSVISDSALRNRVSEFCFEEHGVCDNLKGVRRPSLMSVVDRAGSAFFMLEGNPFAVGFFNDVGAADQSEGFTRKIDFGFFESVLQRKIKVEGTAREHIGVREPDFLDLFQIEQTLTIRKRMESHDAYLRVV
jgi:hypothetical protein